MNGELVDWENARIHILTHTLHYGMGVFEGIRTYETPNGPAVFRLTDHIERLARSAHILGMELPYTVPELIQATKDTVRSTGLNACYVRPIAYYGYGEMGLNTLPCTVDVAIACWPWGAYLGDDAINKGVRMKISSWTRHDHNTMPPASKTTGNYVNSSLAKVEALEGRLRRGDHARPQRARGGVHRREHLRRAQRHHHHPAAVGGRARGHHPAQRHDDRPRPRLRRARRQPRPQRPLHRRGDVRRRHRCRGQRRELGRRPVGAVPRPDDQGHRRDLPAAPCAAARTSTRTGARSSISAETARPLATSRSLACARTSAPLLARSGSSLPSPSALGNLDCLRGCACGSLAFVTTRRNAAVIIIS